jgi:hypothetical protein
MTKPVLIALSLAALFGAAPHGQAPAPKNPYQKLAQPWPEPHEMRQRKAKAEALKLFSAEEPLAFTLAADFRTVNKDRNPNSRKQYPAQLTIAGDGSRTLSVQLNARGHVRRMSRTCEYVPLRIVFQEDQVAGTIFDNQDALKLVVQCRGAGNFEDYVLREYLAYRVLNILTPHSFRARLAKVTYTDAAAKPLGSRYGILLEDDNDVAKRMEGRTIEIPRALFKDVDAATLDAMMLFEYMIGSTDFSIYAVHNVVLVQKPDRSVLPVPYDFDMAGLVSPPYAIPAPRLGIATVKERLYRGPCRTMDEWEAAVTHFRAQKDKILALPDTIPDLKKDSRVDARKYLSEFYDSIKDQKDVKRVLVEACQKAPTM